MGAGHKPDADQDGLSLTRTTRIPRLSNVNAAAGALILGRSPADVLSEAADVVVQQLWHFQRREMAALFRFVPAHKVLEVPLAPGAGRRQVAVGRHENA